MTADGQRFAVLKADARNSAGFTLVTLITNFFSRVRNTVGTP